MTGRSTINNMAIGILRYCIASILFLSGIGKLLDVPGFVQVLVTYQAIPDWGLYPVAALLVLVELRISEWLLRDKTLAVGALGSLVLHAVFTLWTGITLLRGISLPNCGCFGVFFARPLTGWTLVEDLVLVAASFCLLRLTLRRNNDYQSKRNGHSHKVESTLA